jgi:hypothetical protein
MSTNPNTSFRVSSLIGYFVTAVAAVVLPVLLVSPGDRSPYFWQKIVWTQFLVLVVWAYFSGFLWYIFSAGKRPAGQGGVLPVTGIVVVGYAAVSLALVSFCDWSSRGHWAAQVALLVAVVVLFVFLEFARVGARSGTEPIAQGVRTPQELAAQLRFHEDKFIVAAAESPARGIGNAIKSLRETISYSLPQVGTIGASQPYLSLVEGVQRLSSELEALPVGPAPERAQQLCSEAERLRLETQRLVLVLKTKPS